MNYREIYFLSKILAVLVAIYITVDYVFFSDFFDLSFIAPNFLIKIIKFGYFLLISSSIIFMLSMICLSISVDAAETIYENDRKKTGRKNI
jgi:hypothetical protein